MKSQFGRGFAVCLVQFVNHAARLDEYDREYRELARTSQITRRDGSEMWRPEDAAEMWANGAADHLIDLLHPRGITRPDWALAQHIADRSYRIGRTYYPGDNGTPDECRTLLDHARTLLSKIGVSSWDQAFAWDTAHGLKPTPGDSASCKESMTSRRSLDTQGKE